MHTGEEHTRSFGWLFRDHQSRSNHNRQTKRCAKIAVAMQPCYASVLSCEHILYVLEWGTRTAAHFDSCQTFKQQKRGLRLMCLGLTGKMGARTGQVFALTCACGCVRRRAFHAYVYLCVSSVTCTIVLIFNVLILYRLILAIWKTPPNQKPWNKLIVKYNKRRGREREE